ncbi:GntR family transcriptional regulator [Ammoniphilus resinae]|uniref:DNA-binding GntR family transcriptional regulator n=1 Tax=Ammoniphilus resinae TaxID=861532 RepID=A0ABS4GPQ2_9BACL|nr:GntR family transcriptional regulator [Ammoniphilus resinae]MBP1932253.1 DNA-binding GntR family transcriptional regulator [Ammoniphilus resinae]
MARRRNGAKAIEVYNELKKMICSFHFYPGQPLVEGNLTEHFQVSRTPVREAMIKLIQEGFLVEESGHVQVVHLTPDDLYDIFQIRLALEGMAAEIAVSAVSNEGNQLAKKLKALNDEMKMHLEKNNVNRFFDLDEEFHQVLIAAGKNKRIVDILDNLSLQLQRIRRLTASYANRAYQAVEEHDQIVLAVEAQDPVKTKRAVQQHILAVQETIIRLGDLTAVYSSFLLNRP